MMKVNTSGAMPFDCSPGHNNPAAFNSMGGFAAQWGIRTKEFGGRGYNQLVFDDTDQHGRFQLKTTQAHTELNLGRLIHSAGIICRNSDLI